MGAFEYTALDNGGRERKGILEGDTARAVRQTLREQELYPVTVTEVAEKESSKQRGFSFRRGISPLDLALITSQLATLARSGMPLEESLRTISQQTDRPRIKSTLLGVRSRVMEGHTLAAGLGDFPHVFPEIYRSTIAVGEQSGHLDAVMERLADYTERRHELNQQLTNALIYPMILVFIAFSVIALLMAVVVPKVVTVFDSLDQELPALTQLLISTSDFLRANGWFLLIGALLLAVGLRALFRRPGPQRKLHLATLRVPLVGRLVRGFNTARFSRTLSILAGSGVAVLDSLRIAGEVVSNVPMREAVVDASRRVREGAPIGRSLERSKLFPPMMINLIASGEASGKLEEMLERAAVSQEREMNTLITRLMTLLEPLLIVTVGMLVMGIVLAVLLPILNMNQAIV